MIVWIPAAIVTVAFMELWAALLHGGLWHGALWPMHAPHHTRKRGLTWNDALSASHAPPAVALILAGCLYTGLLADLAFGIGVGMTAFGAAYVLVHDGFVHERLPLRFLRRVPYLERIRRAHMVHHGTDGPPYGLFAPFGEREKR